MFDGLVERHGQIGDAVGAALWSSCGTYRYALSRSWNADLPRLLAVMLNPSRADAAQNDPTVTRVAGRARANGYGALRVLNLFALAATDPGALPRSADPVGPCNDAVLRDSLAMWNASAVLCAWGARHARHMNRDRVVLGVLHASGLPLLHLGLTRQGAPRHPLYVANAVAAATWFPA